MITRPLSRRLFPLLLLTASCAGLWAADGGKFDGPDAVSGVAKGLTVTRWAETPLVKSPVAIAIDAQGRAWVTQTVRRRESDPDIREHREWIPGDLACRSVEDKRQFLRTMLAPEKSLQNLWVTDRNGDGSHDWRDLAVQSEKVHLVTDSDGDGKADTSVVYAEGFNTEVTGIAAGVLHYRGETYVTVAPDVWKLRDTDGDGKADQREVIAHGFGLHIGLGGHDMHGLTVGPDGRLYWSIGDKALNVTTKDGRNFAFPYEGAVMRCELDGSNFEVFAHGLRNPQEIAFDEFGNLFSVDNDSDLPGDRERLVYITEQSDTGWRTYWQYREGAYNVWMAERYFDLAHEGQAAFITPPLAFYSDGPCGFKYNPGTALGESLRRHFFLAEFKGGSAGKSSVTAFTVKPKGAAFELGEAKTIFGGTLATGLDFGPDGALYIADWVEGWVPHERGGIWRVDDPSGAAQPIRAEVRQLLGEGMSRRDVAALAGLLSHADMRVRMEAQFELVRRNEGKTLLDAARQTQHRLARLHGIWGLGQLARRTKAASAELESLLGDSDEEVVCQALKTIGDLHAAADPGQIRALIGHSSDRVAFFAAITAGKIRDAAAHDALVNLLAVRGTDAWLRHAAVTGLVNIGDADRIAALLRHQACTVNLGAVVALRRMKDARVAEALQAADELIATEAARAIYDDWNSIDAALPALAMLKVEGRSSEPLIRRVIHADLRLGGAEHARHVMQIATSSGVAPAMREEAITALGLWKAPPVLDRVEGCYRTPTARPEAGVAAVNALFDTHLAALLAKSPDEVRMAAVRAAAALGYRGATQSMVALVKDAKNPAALRLEAMKALGELKDEQLAAAVRAALADNDTALRSEGLRYLAQVDTVGEDANVARLEAVLKKSTKGEKQMALDALGRMSGDKAGVLLGKQLDRLLKGDAYPDTALDVLLAAERSVHPAVKAKLAEYESRRDKADPLAAFAECMVGGNRERGRKTFMDHFAAQCIRCHKVKSVGSDVAPDLTNIATRAKGDRKYMLQSMVDPSAIVAPGYGTIVVTLKSGEFISGTLREESAGVLTVKTADGQTKTIAAADIATRSPIISGMPPMGAILSKQELRDVVEYLMSLK